MLTWLLLWEMMLQLYQLWAAELKWGRKSFEGDPGLRHLSMATIQENIDYIHQMRMDDNGLTFNHLGNVLSISCEQVENILNKELGMSKILI